ncbi:11540_t:CDS:2 [Gigaspora margarita]|uniref:11540_t:CDS:1 n=1 Tax=Gigaspora margarita TaxID=4874 RepID=A0ABN7VBM6_GIGMA|nr:11540_t:CDS:2 [Gigaspora margarita]
MEKLSSTNTCENKGDINKHVTTIQINITSRFLLICTNASVQILPEVVLSEVETEFPLCMTIKVHDLIITSHHADKQMTKEIKIKLLAPHNSISQNELEHLYNSQNSIYDNMKLHQLIKRDCLCARKI